LASANFSETISSARSLASVSATLLFDLIAHYGLMFYQWLHPEILEEEQGGTNRQTKD
jgi:hypothetical protein